ncbi:MAG: ABC transporter substrate-binding protein [Chloroflexi bacterium]|nr:ABC transporter substrate-binding protein [Chloroflexota bacterium]
MHTNGSLMNWLAFTLLLSAACAPSALAPKPAPAEVSRPATSGAVATTPAATPKPAAEQPKYGGVLTRAIERDPDSLDLQRESGSPSSTTMFNVYQGLVRFHPIQHEKIMPELAESWDVSADGKTYTFKFFKDIKWHDGKPLTVEDVKYSLDRMQNPKAFNTISPRGQGLLAAMDKAEVAGDTIKITTKYPSASFLNNIATGWVAIAPKAILEAKGDMRRDTVGTGPFKMKQFNPNSSVELEKNRNYHIKGLPYLDGIQFYTIKDAATRFAALRTGKIKMTFWTSGGLSPTEAEMVRRDMADRITVYDHDALTRATLTFNLKRSPWSDLRVRKAVDLAIDRQAAIKVNGGRGHIGSIYGPLWGIKESDLAKLPGYRQPKDADLAEAKRLMAQAGYPNGLKTTLLVGSKQEQAVLAKNELAKIGIDAELLMVDSPIRYDMMERRAFDLDSFRWTDNTGDPDETLFTFYYTGGSRNYASFSNKEVDELIDKQARTMDPGARRAIVDDIEKRIMEELSILIFFWDVAQTGAWNEVKNFRPGTGFHQWSKLDQVWLEK